MPISYCSEWTTASGKIRRAYPGGVEKEVGYTYRGEKIYYNEWTRLQLHVPCHSGDETEDSADGGTDSLATVPSTPAYDWRQPKDYSQNTYSPTQSNRISPEESAARVLGSKAIGADILQQMYRNNPVLAAMTAYNPQQQPAGSYVAGALAGREDDPLKNTHGKRVHTMEEFLNKNRGVRYENLINQLPKSDGLPGGPEMRYVRNPIDGNVMDMRHVLVVGYLGTSMGGILVELAQWFGPWFGRNSRGSAFDKQDYYSNNIGAAFADFMAHPASANRRKQDFVTVFYNFIYGKYAIPVWK